MEYPYAASKFWLVENEGNQVASRHLSILDKQPAVVQHQHLHAQACKLDEWRNNTAYYLEKLETSFDKQVKKNCFSHSVYEKVDCPDFVSTVLEGYNVHQTVVIATCFLLFSVKATYDTNTGHCLIHSIAGQSHGVLNSPGQPLRAKQHHLSLTVPRYENKFDVARGLEKWFKKFSICIIKFWFLKSV